mgnify:CR=1 FL=1
MAPKTPAKKAVAASAKPKGKLSRRGKKSRKKDHSARPTAGDGAPGGDTP